MREALRKMFRMLIREGYNDNQIMAITAPLETEDHINQMMKWLQENPQATVKEMTRKSLEISEA
jgi:RNA binding exosome subunit